jgi:hypothetical protein
MKDKVTVDGVVLTRAQIEAAVRELDAKPVERKLVVGVEGFRQRFTQEGGKHSDYHYFPLDHNDIISVAHSLTHDENDGAVGISIGPTGRITMCYSLGAAPITTAIRSEYPIVRIHSLNTTEVTE